MSSTIFYHETIVRIPAEHAGATQELFVHLCQGGSSNCYEMGWNGRDGRRSRGWQVNAFGTAKQVLAAGIKVAGDLEGGGLKLGSATEWSKPETYIRRVRRLLKEADQTNALESCNYKGHRVWFSPFIHENAQDVVAGKTDYDFHDSASFKAFYTRFNANRGYEGMGFNYFTASGPEMR